MKNVILTTIDIFMVAVVSFSVTILSVFVFPKYGDDWPFIIAAVAGIYGYATVSFRSKYRKTLLIITALVFFCLLILILSQPRVSDHSPNGKRTSALSALRAPLELYYDEHQKYPLCIINCSEALFAQQSDGWLPTDNFGNPEYAYAISRDQQKYHIGTPARADGLTEMRLKTDADFDSAVDQSAWINGFNGSDDGTCGIVSEMNGGCYDLISY